MPQRWNMLTPEERYRELAEYFIDHIHIYDGFNPKEFKPSWNKSFFLDLLENEDTVRSVLSNMWEVESVGNVDQPINDLIDHMRSNLNRPSIKYVEDYNNLKQILKDGNIELIRDTLRAEESMYDMKSVSELKLRPSYTLLIKQLKKKASVKIDLADDDGEFSDVWEDVNELEPLEPEPEPEHLNDSLRLPRDGKRSSSEPETRLEQRMGTWNTFSDSSSDESDDEPEPGKRSKKSPRRRSQAMDESRGRPAEPGIGERLWKCLDRNCSPKARISHKHTKKKKKHTKKKKKQTKKKKKPIRTRRHRRN